ncbi:MAG: hypothetical protein H6Q75_803 [Firmicutes bacterium]|nr:hypothetical protein [Bacillota bacterium]
MRCVNCGRVLEQEERCQCRETEATRLAPEERENFQGITVETESDARSNYQYRYQQQGANQGIHISHMTWGLGRMKWTTKLLIVAVIVVFVVVFLPLAVFFMVIASLLWMLTRFLRR